MSLLVAPRWTYLPASPAHASVRARTTAMRSCRVSRSSSSTRFTVTSFVVAFFVISAAASRGTRPTLDSARARAVSKVDRTEERHAPRRRQGPRLLRSFWRCPRRGGLRPLGRRLVRWIRQRDREGGPASRLGDDLNRAVMALDDLLDEDESEAESFRPRFRRDEGLEQAGPHLGVDPRPCVEDGDRDVIVL